MRRLILALLCAAALLGGCASPGERADPAPERALPSVAATVAPSVPAPPTVLPRRAASNPLPGITPQHLTLAYWTRRTPDTVLLDAAAVRRHDAALRRPGGPAGQIDLALVPHPATVDADAAPRLTWMRERLEQGELVLGDGSRLLGPALDPLREAHPRQRLEGVRRVEARTPVHCAPLTTPLFKPPVDPAFDRNLCSTLSPGEPVRPLGVWSNGLVLVQSRAVMGWLPADARLSPPLSPEDEARALAPRPTRDLTRHAFLAEAFRWLDTPYGWGGAGGGVDCSEFLQRVFEVFGLALPRNSAEQGRAGAYTVEVPATATEAERLALLDAAHARGVVLMHFPGHIMLYLGRDEAGVPMGLHAFAEYLEPNATDPAGETLVQVPALTVSTLDLGRGTSRRAFLERTTHLAVFGPAPGPDLAPLSVPRPPAPLPEAGPDLEAACARAGGAKLLVSPASPDTTRPARLLLTSRADPGAAEITLVSPTGERTTLPSRSLAGPPFARIATWTAPSPGRWRVVFGDGDALRLCRMVQIAPFPRPRKPSVEERDALDGGAVWWPRAAWDATTEDQYSAFVEHLFDAPLEGEKTWPVLDLLLRDPERNLLYDHHAPGEEAALRLGPDCADLPYTLRAYFAWRLGLPFGFRGCDRGAIGRPPRCEAVQSPHAPEVVAPGLEGAARFSAFARRVLGNVVQSANGRTHPDDSETDLYPVALTRETLRPGTVFADPYGHMLVLARWVPQGVDGAGRLIGAESQPDATVGRRTFWRGSFLFTPDTRQVGAGFKAWRPVRFAPDTGSVEPLDNARLAQARAVPRWSRQQYDAPLDAWYDRIEALANPRPRDARVAMRAIVDALEEAVVRRVTSVQNGEDFQRTRPTVIPMPSGAAIFQTAGPWEDYSTPSRDLRLLIALDATLRFPAVVRGAPARFQVAAQDAEATERALTSELAAALAARSFAYTRSDGSPWRLSLADIVARQRAFEVAYNPNDCPEVRWGAPERSDEAAPCTRRAPPAQRAAMETLRGAFATRTRPLR